MTLFCVCSASKKLINVVFTCSIAAGTISLTTMHAPGRIDGERMGCWESLIDSADSVLGSVYGMARTLY